MSEREWFWDGPTSYARLETRSGWWGQWVRVRESFRRRVSDHRESMKDKFLDARARGNDYYGRIK